MIGMNIMIWFVTAAIVWSASPVASMLLLSWMTVDWVSDDYIATKKKNWRRA